MFTLKTQGVFERFQREHYIPRPSVRWWRFRNVQGNGCTFIPVWGRWGVMGRDVLMFPADLTSKSQCAKLFFDYNCLQYVQ